ncbi:hypothetical protein PQR08_25090 [Caballeronia jiangsuensis]|uniref:Uncharacterized protein n=1 Tax=Caballeronia jiangsuensis TaxID=1458357 RepID=A0ABW9CSL3_9BURK
MQRQSSRSNLSEDFVNGPFDDRIPRHTGAALGRQGSERGGDSDLAPSIAFLTAHTGDTNDVVHRKTLVQRRID